MRSTLITTLTVAALGLLGAPLGAEAQAPDVRAVKPVVMLLVDTSGSMERMPDGDMPLCTGDPTSDEQNRWATTVQTLTGTMQGFTCEALNRTGAGFLTTDYDYGYHLPHHRFQYTSQQNDGILDAYRFRAKFGLMTFDGVATALGSSPLVPLSEWAGSFGAIANGRRGMYDQGSTGKLIFPGCSTAYGINTGARDADVPDEGGMVTPGLGDDEDVILARNAEIQRILTNQGGAKLRPFGGTPIAAMLQDLKEYIEDSSSDIGEADPWNDCREKVAILITDGRPDADFRGPPFDCEGNSGACNVPGESGCSCPYDTAQNIAASMTCSSGDPTCGKALDKLFVVGFSITDPDVVASLNDIAFAGGTKEAIIAEGKASLQAALASALDQSAPDATSRTLSQLSRRAAQVGAAQYEVTAAFRPGANGGPWEGLIERKRYTCNGSLVVENTLNDDEGDRFHVQLAKQTIISSGPKARRIYTFDPGATYAGGTIQTAFSDKLKADAEWTGDPLSDEGLGSTTQADPADTTGEGSDAWITAVDPVPFDPAQFEKKTEYFTGTSGEVTPHDIMQWLVPDGSDPNHPRLPNPLGAVYHSDPVIVEAPLPNTKDESLNLWRSQPGIVNRPAVVYVATNDGILHAFSLEDWQDTTEGSSHPGYTAGQEMWGFMPPSVMARLAAATQSHQPLLDGTAIVRDVLLDRRPGAESDLDNYRTVLVMANRGTASVFALDVTMPQVVGQTDPETGVEGVPRLLWQFSDDAMGPTFGRPAVAQVLINWGGALVERTVAIIPGGQGEKETSSTGCTPDATRLPDNPDARDTINCWKRQGRQLYLVDVATGELILHFDERHFPSPLTGGVALNAQGVRDVATAAYFTDHDGIVWRLYMGSSDPANWKPEPLYDMFYGNNMSYDAGRSATYPPLVTHDENGDTVLIVGTGDMDNLVDETQVNRIISLTERRTIDENGNVIDTQVKENWVVKLKPSELVTGPLALFEDGVYFGSYLSVSNGQYCEVGQSRLWGVHYNKPDPDSVDDEPLPLLEDNPEDPDNTTFVRYKDIQGNAMIMGVQIFQRPSCTPGEFVTDPVMGNTRFKATGESGGGGFELRAVVSADSSATIEGGKIGRQAGSAVRQLRRRLGTRKMSTRVRGWASSLE